MRRLTVFLASILVFSLAASALATSMPSPPTDARLVGERINILRGTPAEYPAGDAFHIWHGISSDHLADLSEMRDAFLAVDMRVEVDIDGTAILLRPWFNVWEVDATCEKPGHERVLEKTTRAERFLRLADRWDCEATGIWVKGYFYNDRRGMTGPHNFEVRFFQPGFDTEVFIHTVVFTP